MFIQQVVPADAAILEDLVPGWLDPATDVDANGPTLQPLSVEVTTVTDNPDPTTLPDGTAGTPIRWFGQDFYFRIWPIPRVIDVQNPLFNVDIPFKLWSAFLTPNTLQDLIATGAEGLTIDIADGAVLDTLEMRTINVQITPLAPSSIGALFTFDFEYGEAAVSFIAVLADILPIHPEALIQEKLEWKTDILTNTDGTERRIALRQRPRRSLGISLLLLDDEDRKKLYDKLYQVASKELIVPTVQYQSRLKVPTVIGDNKLYTNPRRADLRVGEKVVVQPKTGGVYIFQVETVEADHVTINSTFSRALPKGSLVTNAFGTRLPNKSALQMSAIAGSANLNVDITEPRPQVGFPDSGVPVPTFEGKPLLLRRPISDGMDGEAFDVGLDVIDNETGKPSYHTDWLQPFVEGPRKYLIQTLFEPDDLEHWRQFFDLIRGKQKAFYTSTYRRDQVKYEDGAFVAGAIDVAGTSYASLYYESDTYRQLEIETDRGTFQLKVSAAENYGSFTTIRFTQPIEVDLVGVEIIRISYLLKVRLMEDTVTLTHSNTYSTVELSLRTVVR
jgi:hypothetical protein